MAGYCNKLKLKNMDLRARESKLVSRIKQLETQVEDLLTTEKAFHLHKFKTNVLVNQLEAEITRLTTATRTFDQTISDHKEETKSFKLMLD